MKRFLTVLIAGLFLMPFTARAEKVVADVSSNFVAVTVGFHGTKMLIFGALKVPADVMVIVEGPASRAILRRKVKTKGIWVNSDPVIFSPVPGYYAIAASKPIEAIAGSESIGRYGLRLSRLSLPFEDKEMPPEFSHREALLNLRKSQGLFQEKPSGVIITGESLFRADFDLPATMPIGTYVARIYLLKDKRVIAEQTSSFTVAPVGIQASIYHLAYDRPFTYAFMALGLSLLLGGAGAFVFRRSS